jgi:hypothetical protein
MFVCCVLSGRGLCDELITRPEGSYRLWYVVVCDQETSWYEEAIAHTGLQSQRNKQTNKWFGYKVEHSTSSAKVKNEWSCTSSVTVHLHGTEKDTLTFYLYHLNMTLALTS